MKKSNLWIKCSLGEVAKLKNGYAFKSEEYQNQGVPIVRISDINDGIVQVENSKFIYQDAEFEKYSVETGDILIAMSGQQQVNLAFIILQIKPIKTNELVI